jgi:hypothetical protein
MFTNFGDLNTINKKASKLFFGDLVHFSNLEHMPAELNRGFSIVRS